jgi:hypothetical protein
MESHATSSNPAAGLGRLLAAREAERRRFAAEAQARARRRILDAAQVDPDTLSKQGQRILDWLADWDRPTIDGLVELLTAARVGADAGRHRVRADHLKQAAADGSARLDAAMARFDGRPGQADEEPGVEL